MNWSVETSIMCNVAANGLVNLFTPTCGFIMGALLWQEFRMMYG